jgi:hypothetical protein
MRLVEAGTSRPGAIATVRFDFCRRHPMQAGHGGATRVYVHGHLKWRTVPNDATRPSARALSLRRAGAVNPSKRDASHAARRSPARNPRHTKRSPS